MSILAAQLENPELREENRKEIYENLLDVLLSGEKEIEKQISDILKQGRTEIYCISAKSETVP